MAGFTVLVVLCCVLGSVLGNDSQCSASTMKIVLRSHHNETGHWQSKVVFRQGDQGSLSTDMPDLWTVDVQQATVLCDEGKTTLETTLLLTAPTQPNDNLVDTSNPGNNKPTHPQTPSPPVKVVPAGYQLHPGVGYYKFHHDVTTWPVAKQRCETEGGHLVIINNAAEREVVRVLYAVQNPNSAGSNQPEQIHTGLHKVGNAYVTIFGVPIGQTGFSTWYAGQPSSPGTEHCISIMRENITFNDMSCTIQVLAYICEIEL